ALPISAVPLLYRPALSANRLVRPAPLPSAAPAILGKSTLRPSDGKKVGVDCELIAAFGAVAAFVAFVAFVAGATPFGFNCTSPAAVPAVAVAPPPAAFAAIPPALLPPLPPL